MYKSDEENKMDLRREAAKNAAFISGFIFIVTCLMVKLGYNKWRVSIDAIPWRVFFINLIWITLLTLIVFFLTYRSERKKIWKSKSQTIVCLNCGDIKTNNDETSCRCGGKLADLNHAKWIDSEKSIKPAS